MLNPSRTHVLLAALLGFVGLVLGLATEVGFVGWSLAALFALYLGAAGIARLVRGRPLSDGRQA